MSDKMEEMRAIQASIAKWEGILSGKEPLICINEQCAMCRYYGEPKKRLVDPYVQLRALDTSGQGFAYMQECVVCALARMGHGCLLPHGTYKRLVKKLPVLSMQSMGDPGYPEERAWLEEQVGMILRFLREALQDCKGVVVPLPDCPLHDWKRMDPVIRFIAVDADGSKWGFEQRPRQGGTAWVAPPGTVKHQLGKDWRVWINERTMRRHLAWQDSLEERPLFGLGG